MDVGILGKHGDTRVHHDQRELALFTHLLQTPVNDRVLLRQVGAKGQQAVGVFKVLVATGRAVRAEGALVTGDGRRHAQGGVAVVVVGADHAARQFAQGVELLGHDLAGGNDGKGIAAIVLLDALDLVGRLVQRLVPAGLAEFIPAVVADQRLVAAPGGLAEQLMFEHALDAELATVDIGIGDAARGHRFIVGVQADLNGTAGGAIATGGIAPFPDALVGDLDGVLFVASE